MNNMKVKHRLALGFGGLLAIIIIAMSVAIVQIRELQGNIDEIANQNIPRANMAATVANNINIATRSVRNMLLMTDAQQIAGQQKQLDDTLASISEEMARLSPGVPEAGKVFFEHLRSEEATHRSQLATFRNYFSHGQKAEARDYLLKTLRDTQLRYLKAVDDYVAFEQNSSQKLAKHTLASATSANLLLTSLLVGAVLVALLASWLISRSLWRQLGGEPADAVRLMEELAEGEVVSEFKLKDGDTSSLFAHIKTTAHNAVENLRVRNALDASATNMMIADANFRVVYANQAVTAMFQRAEQDIRQELPNFSARELLGSSIDVFHKNPAHPRQLMQSLRSVHQATIRIGGHTFSQTMTPIFSKTGKSLGAVVEWKDRTAELEVEREVADIVQAAANGDLTTRIALHNKRGFYRQLGEGVNQLLDVTTRGLGDIADVLGGLAEGDLTRSIDSEYQGLFGRLKDDTNTTVERLKAIVGHIKESTEAINTAAREIAAGNANLSSRTEQQAASLEETASSMEEITSTVRQNAENARKANALATGASDIATRGGVVVGDVVATMQEINDSARKIVDIISVIDGIAFQTNILALNAAVEAARAGEQGRGFAVVASEVRNLAQRSAAAAKEIKTLIGDSVDKVESGSRLVNEAGHTMEEIVVSIRRVADIMGDISAASMEQSSGIEQVNLAVTQMDENTQKNAALVEEAAAAAESLEEQSRYLVDAVAMFRLDYRPVAAAPLTWPRNGAQPVRAASPAVNTPAEAVLPGPAVKPVGRLPAAERFRPTSPALHDDEWEEF